MDKPGAGSWHRFRVEKPLPASLSCRSPPGDMEDSRDFKDSSIRDSVVEKASASASPTPGTLAMYACIRCRNSKKKCDRIQPECTACKRLGTRCFFPSPVASSSNQVASLRARVAWLSSFVETLLPAGSAPMSCYDTGFDLSTLPLVLPTPGATPDSNSNSNITNTPSTTARPGPTDETTSPHVKMPVPPEDYDMDGTAAGVLTAGVHQQHTPSSLGVSEPAHTRQHHQHHQSHQSHQSLPAPQSHHPHQYQYPLPPPPIQQLPLPLPPVSASTPTAYTLPSPSNSRDAARYAVGDPVSTKPRFASIRLLTGRFDRMHLVRAYFRHMHRSYPFLYEEAIMSAAESHVGRALFEDGCEIDLASAKLYLVMILGLEAISRFGSRSSRGKGTGPVGGPPGTAPSDDNDDEDRDIAAAALSSVCMPYQDIVLACLTNRCISAVEVLLLLALYALFDPDGWSAWVIVGMLGREAILLGLNRRWPTDPAEPDLLQREFRHRLFWSIFSLDRLVASVYGLSLAIQDFDSNLALPGVTTEEFAASTQAEHIATLQIARQAIALRDIEGRCLSLVHLGHDVGSGVAAAALGQGLSLSHPAAPFQQPPQQQQQQRMLLPSLRERRAMIEELRGAADNWYTQGTLLARREAHAVHFHNTITWLNTNYHGMLMLLYCPSVFNSGPATSEDLLDLHRTIGKYVQSVHAQFLDRQLALNWTTMSRMLLVCRILLHAYLNLCTDTEARSSGNRNNYSFNYNYSCQAPPEHLPNLLAEQLDMAIQCENILHAFQPAWVFARKGAVLYRRLEAALRHRLQHVHVHEQVPAQSVDVVSDIHDICDEVEQLVQETLGVASTYNYLAGEPRTRPRKVYR